MLKISIRVVDLDGKPVVGATISGKIEQLNGKQEVQYVSKFDELFLNIGPLSGSDIYSSDIAKLRVLFVASILVEDSH